MSAAMLGVVRHVLSLLPLMLIAWGWIEWMESKKRPLVAGMRRWAIALGLGVASIPALCFAGLILWPRLAMLGSWNNYPVASFWGRWNLPLSILAVILGVAGKGNGRWLLIVGGSVLIIVWTMALVHWPASA